MTNKDIVRKLVLREIEMMQPNIQSFEDNPIEFLLQKYPTMKGTLEMLMTPAFKDYITGIYIVAPKPTTFKIVLHNDQDFYLTYMGKVYEANVSGKKFYLQTIGEKERCMEALARLLALGNPIHTKGDEGEEQAAEAEPTEKEAAAAGGTKSEEEVAEETES